MLSKVILLLNATILVVNFSLVLAGQSEQADLAMTVALTSSRAGAARGAPAHSSPALRLLQSLEQYAPRDTIDAMSGAQIRALFDALDHHAWLVEEGIEELRRKGQDGARTRAAVEELGKAVRAQVQEILERQFRDGELVNRVTAAILGGGR